MTWKLSFVPALSLMLSAAFTPRQICANTDVVAVNHAPPYRIIETHEGENRYAGVYIDFVREIAKRSGLTLSVKEVPFIRTLAMMRNGDADLMISPNRNPERETKAVFTPADAGGIGQYSDLTGKRIGVLRSARYFERFDQDQSLKKYDTSHYETAFEIAARGRLDLVIAPMHLGDFLVNSTPYKLDKRDLKWPGKPSFIAVSKKSPLSLQKQRMESELQAMKDDGTIESIIGKYR